jgi:hypothetical protein
MSDPITNTPAQTSEGEGVNTAGVEGAATQAAQAEAPRFTQAQLDAIIENRLAQQNRSLTARYETDLATKIQEALAQQNQTLEAQVEERVNAKLAEKALVDTRASIQSEFGLTDAQVARLTGTTPDELTADAEALFGALKQAKPPVVRRGDAVDTAVIDISKMTPAEIREKGRELWNNTFQ